MSEGVSPGHTCGLASRWHLSRIEPPGVEPQPWQLLSSGDTETQASSGWRWDVTGCLLSIGWEIRKEISCNQKANSESENKSWGFPFGKGVALFPDQTAKDAAFSVGPSPHGYKAQRVPEAWVESWHIIWRGQSGCMWKYKEAAALESGWEVCTEKAGEQGWNRLKTPSQPSHPSGWAGGLICKVSLKGFFCPLWQGDSASPIKHFISWVIRSELPS